MEPYWAALSFAAVLVVAFVSWMAGGKPAARTWPTWETLLNAKGREAHDRLASDLADSHEALRLTLRLARAERERGEHAEAVRVLREAAAFVARHVPGVRERLWTWLELARALLAVEPPPRLFARGFRSWRLRGASVAESLLRPLLDNAHRFALRVRLLVYGLGLIVRRFDAVANKAQPEAGPLMRTLESMDSLAVDLNTLDRASLDVLKALLLAHEANQANARRAED
jgi:hypothetical protein